MPPATTQRRRNTFIAAGGMAGFAVDCRDASDASNAALDRQSGSLAATSGQCSGEGTLQQSSAIAGGKTLQVSAAEGRRARGPAVGGSRVSECASARGGGGGGGSSQLRNTILGKACSVCVFISVSAGVENGGGLFSVLRGKYEDGLLFHTRLVTLPWSLHAAWAEKLMCWFGFRRWRSNRGSCNRRGVYLQCLSSCSCVGVQLHQSVAGRGSTFNARD